MLLEACKELFPERAAHFALLSVMELGELDPFGMPATYDFVYWNVWDDFDVGAPAFHGYFERILATVGSGRRLILGFYDADRARTEAKIAWLAEQFRPLQAKSDNKPFEEVFVWWNR